MDGVPPSAPAQVTRTVRRLLKDVKMNTRLILTTCMILSFLTACRQTTLPTASATSTAIPTDTHTPTATHTPSPTPTQTPIPTPIGGSEPKVAFVGKDSQGNYGIYVDGFFTRQPKKIAPISVSDEYTPFLQMKWSSDGTKLIFIDGVPTAERSFFLFDAITGETREIAEAPNQEHIADLTWSQDGNEIFFTTFSSSNPASGWKLDLSSESFSETDEVPGINSSFHLNTSINCDFSSIPESIKSIYYEINLDGICFHPDLNAHYALRRNEDSTDLVLLSPSGEVGDTLVTFPAGFYTNGFISLLLSPDKSHLLIVGDGGIGTTGHQFAYTAPLASLPLDKSNPQLFDESTASQHFVHVYGWSPDGKNYLVASGLWTDYKFAIIWAGNGNVLYEYKVPAGIEPAFFIIQSAYRYDMIWPVLP